MKIRSFVRLFLVFMFFASVVVFTLVRLPWYAFRVPSFVHAMKFNQRTLFRVFSSGNGTNKLTDRRKSPVYICYRNRSENYINTNQPNKNARQITPTTRKCVDVHHFFRFNFSLFFSLSNNNNNTLQKACGFALFFI